MQDTLQSIKKSGNLNPMWGKRHDEETKKKIADLKKGNTYNICIYVVVW